MNNKAGLGLVLLSALTLGSLHARAAGQQTYDQDTVLAEATAFFGKGAKGLARVVEKVFKEQGRPSGYIKGEEVGGAIGVGVRYGDGTLFMRDGAKRKLHWQGPSIGIDFGANAAKVFVLVYQLPDADGIYKRYPGVEGSLYFVAGVGVHYARNGKTVLAPIRMGVGWRQGASVGYMHITRKKSWIPF